MFGIGSGEMLVFAVVVLIALGPKRLPDFMRTVGKGLREIRRATNDLRKHSGIDELMRDDPAGLRALSRDISRAPAPRREQKINADDRAKEAPIEGVDIAHARQIAKKHVAAAAKESAAARDAAAATEAVVVAATVPIGSAEPDPAQLDPTGGHESGFEGDTLPDKGAGPAVRHEPTMMGIPAVDPYALPTKKPDANKTMAGMPALGADGKVKLPGTAKKTSIPPPPPKRARTSVPPPPPLAASKSAVSKTASRLPPAGPKRSVPPPPPPPRIKPSELLTPGSKRASLPPSIPPPAPSITPSSPPEASGNEKPNAREATMALEVEDLTTTDPATGEPNDKRNAREATMALEVEDLTLTDES